MRRQEEEAKAAEIARIRALQPPPRVTDESLAALLKGVRDDESRLQPKKEAVGPDTWLPGETLIPESLA